MSTRHNLHLPQLMVQIPLCLTPHPVAASGAVPSTQQYRTDTG